MRRWFSRLLRRRQLEDELNEELRFHLEMQAEANRVAGMPADEALRAARREFGHVDSVKEACRDQRRLGWLEDTWRDLRQAARSLRRDSSFALSAIAILALSVAAMAIVSMYYEGYLLSDPPYLREPDGVVTVLVRGEKQMFGERLVSAPDFREWQEQARCFEAFAAYVVIGGPVSAGGRHEHAAGLGVGGSFFEALGVQPMLGRAFSTDDYSAGAPRVAIISHRFWQDRFGGDKNVLGHQLVAFKTSLMIIGVMPADFDFPSRQAFWAPIDRSNSPAR